MTQAIAITADLARRTAADKINDGFLRAAFKLALEGLRALTDRSGDFGSPSELAVAADLLREAAAVVDQFAATRSKLGELAQQERR